jgi:predicted lipoprotein with Yx(FWY)xxD motif
MEDLLKRIALLITAGMALAVPISATAGAASTGTKVDLRSTHDGKILVNGSGFTLYAFTKDATRRDNCMKIRGCIAVWPPLTTTGNPVAGPGLKASLLGSIPYKGSLKQVTYAGHPLYTYKEDDGPGSTEYIDESQSGGRWPALSASGQEVGSDSD